MRIGLLGFEWVKTVQLGFTVPEPARNEQGCWKMADTAVIAGKPADFHDVQPCVE
jgi:hypothetical protein